MGWQPKPCRNCGGPKGGGRGRKYCDNCILCCDEHEAYQHGCLACDSIYRKDWRKRNPESAKRAVKKSAYGLTDEQYDELDAIKLCENCGSGDRMVIDHDHVTGKVRGKLCHKCNVALGMARDDITILEGLINYLKERG